MVEDFSRRAETGCGGACRPKQRGRKHLKFYGKKNGIELLRVLGLIGFDLHVSLDITLCNMNSFFIPLK